MANPDARQETEIDRAVHAASGLAPIPPLQTDAESLAHGMTAPPPLPEVKGPAERAYLRLIDFIRRFEAGLDDAQEVAIGFAGSDAGLLRIEGLGFAEPDLLTFFGRDESGSRSQLIQHISQLNVLLRAVVKTAPEEPARRIGFRLVSGWHGGEAGDASATNLGEIST